jgi:4-carboxymuconolactone decarboxylase
MSDNKTETLGDLFDKGLQARREVLGAAYVDNSLKQTNDFMMSFQHMVTEWCWGYAWNREGIDRKTRSMLNLAMLTALNRPEELRLHLRGALRNGATREEVVEVLLQTAIYCGIPAANAAFREARQIFAEIDREEATELHAVAAE